MRGTAAALVCLVSLHYLSVTDAYTARFTSENGMPGREHEDQYPRRSDGVKRSSSADDTIRQYQYYDDWEYSGGIPNMPPDYQYRDAGDVVRDTYLDRDDSGDGITSPLSPGDNLPLKSAGVKRGSSADKTMRQYQYYDNWEYSGGIPNIPGGGNQYRDADIDADAAADADKSGFSKTLQRLLSPVVDAVRQLWEKLSGKSLETVGDESAVTDTKRQNARNEALMMRPMENRTVGDLQTTIPKKEISSPIKFLLDIAKKALDFAFNIIDKIDASQLPQEAKKLKQAVLDALKKARKALEELLKKFVGNKSAVTDTKRHNAHNEALKKRAMENQTVGDLQTTSPKKEISSPIKFLLDIAKKALDFAFNIIDKIDASQLPQEAKKLKQAVLDALKKARKALEELQKKVVRGVDSPYSRRARSVRKRTNARDALDSYLTGLRSQKRSKTRNSLRRSPKRNSFAEPYDMSELFKLMTEMEECINNISATNTSLLGVKCIVAPLMRSFASPKQERSNNITADADPNVGSDGIGSPDNLRRLNFPWGSVFLIPIYNGQRSDNSTISHQPGPNCDNVTTTTTEPTTTTTTTTTEAQSIYDEPDRAARSDSKYRSKYDNDF